MRNKIKFSHFTKRVVLAFLKKFKIYMIVIVLLLFFVVFYILYIDGKILMQSKTTDMGFKNIGELATQNSYCTQVGVIDEKIEIWGIKIPFTQSKYIYSYDVIIKAGIDFEEIDWNIDNNIIVVELPKAKILSNEIIENSFKIYHEQESIFTQISLEETSKAREQLKKEAENTAINNGIYENALKNAKTMLTAFFEAEYDMNKYKIKFVEK